jgi:flagellar biosynthesis component FlhA
VTGYKRGPLILAIVFGGMLVGAILGGLMVFALFRAPIGAAPGQADSMTIGAVIVAALPWLLVSFGAACVGAYTRLR